MQPFFKSLQINNLLSFGPDSPPIELGPLNVIIGANGSGKSNLFDVLALLKNTPGEFDKPIRESGCPLKEWFWKGSEHEKKTISIEVDILVRESLFSHRIVLQGQERLRITEEVIKTPTVKIMGDPTALDKFIKVPDSKSELSEPMFTRSLLAERRIYLDNQVNTEIYDQLRKGLKIEEYEQVLIEFYRGIYLYNDWAYGRKSPLRFPQNAALSEKWLNEDGSNFFVVLKKIKNNEKSYSRYLEFLKQLYEGVDDFEIIQLDNLISIRLVEGEKRIPAARLSDGTLRYLMLLAVLCDPEPPPVVCIEEPEMGLHPDLIHVMGKALEYAAERTQVIVTTHSVQLVDCFTPTPEVIQVCEKREGQTYIERLDPEKMQVWLDDYRLGDLWTSGEIGGNRW